MLTGKGATGKNKQKKHNQYDKEKSGECYQMYDETKIIPQNLYAIQNSKENFLFCLDGVIVPSLRMIFSLRLF